MHYHLELHVSAKDEEEALYQAEDIMNYLCSGRGAIGDWYQIGGRWKGIHDPEYDPDKDPDNYEPCRCEGKDKDCPRCRGTGQAPVWPTSWKRHPKDIIPVSEAPAELLAFAFFGEGYLYAREDDFCDMELFDGNVINLLEELEITDGYLVTVDVHS